MAAKRCKKMASWAMRKVDMVELARKKSGAWTARHISRILVMELVDMTEARSVSEVNSG